MKEVKFRGRNYEGVWMYGYLMPTPKPQIHLDCKFSICVSPQALNTIDRVLYEVETNTIGQYIGLKDKNGKDIYEGDIVQNLSGKTGYIAFLKQEMGYVVVWHNCDTRLGHRSRGGNYDCDNSIEIVGNIYDNPELLKSL